MSARSQLRKPRARPRIYRPPDRRRKIRSQNLRRRLLGQPGQRNHPRRRSIRTRKHARPRRIFPRRSRLPLRPRGPEKVFTAARHPRDRADWPLVGIFAQRAKDRPNRIGITTCKIERIDGLHIFVRELDAIDGTPILDIKPYIPDFGPREPVRQSALRIQP